MSLSGRDQAAILGQVFEIAVQRGVLANLIAQGLLDRQHPMLHGWVTTRNGHIYSHFTQALDLTDANAQAWAKTTFDHLLVLGYGLGWTAMRECRRHTPVRKPKLEAIWCPLTLPGVQIDREDEKEATAEAFQSAFHLPGHPDLAWVKRGQPARADFLLWLASESTLTSQWSGPEQGRKQQGAKLEHSLLCLEFSYNAPAQLADFSQEEAHREEVSRYARFIDSRGVFSRVCAQVSGEAFLISSNLANHLSVFSSSDKPLFKLCQAASYTEGLVQLLRAKGRLQGACSTRAIAVTSNGFESLAAYFQGEQPEPDPRAKLMQSLGEAYRKAHKLTDEAPKAELDAEIRLVFKKLLQSLPRDFKQQAQQLIEHPTINGNLHHLFQEKIEDFHKPMLEVSCEEAIQAVEETAELNEFFGGSPRTRFAAALAQQNPKDNALPLRQVHAAAIVAGLGAAQAGRLNVIALEGNPGIGKTTAVTQFLKQQTEGYLFLYISPRVVINRDVTMKLAKANGEASGILTLTTNAKLITSAPQWYEQQVQTRGWPRQVIDSAVVVDGVANLQKPVCNTVFITPEEEHEIDCNVVSSTRFKRTQNDREDSVASSHRPGVLRTLAGGTRRLLAENPQVNRLVITAATQGYRAMAQSSTINALNHLFAKPANTSQGRNERQAFSQRIPTIIAMVDELAGDGAGALFAHRLSDWLHQQFIAPFEGMDSPFRVILIISDASLSNEVVLNNYLAAGDRAPGKVLISQSQGEYPFRVTGTSTKVGMRRHPTLHVMTNSYPASALAIDYSIRLASLTLGLTSSGEKQRVRQAIREQASEELLSNAYREVCRGLDQNSAQLIFFAQDKAFLRQLREKLTRGPNAILTGDQVAVLDQSVPEQERVLLVQEPRRDQIRVFLMTSSGARGVSFPKTDWIIAWIPRFSIEAALMEVAQLIYRGRGFYTDPETGQQVSGDDQARRLVMLINDFVVLDDDIDHSRLWLRQTSDLLTLLVMLRSTIYTRIKGDAGLRRQRIAFVPVGSVGDEEILSLMSEDVQEFLREAQVYLCDDHPADTKQIVAKAERLVQQVFADFNLKGQANDTQTKSFATYAILEAFIKSVTRSSSSLLPVLDEALIIPDFLSCVGPFWMEDWSNRQTEERFRFEGWRNEVQHLSRTLLGLLHNIADGRFPPKLRRPAKELHKLLVREKAAATQEYATLQALKSDKVMIGLPLDYPHFWKTWEDSDRISRQPVVEDPEVWRSALGRSLTSQGAVMPVVPEYKNFPWAATAGRSVAAELETIFKDCYFMASSELNLLNTILLED